MAEAVALLAAPAAVFFGLRVAPMAPLDMIDPTFYTAYAQHGADLVTRYGLTYYAVRLGFLLPAEAAYRLFGALGGFYALRYLLALLASVPVYLLLRRLYGRPAGALGVAVVLTSPVLLTAWGTDYPDSTAVSYLVAGGAALVMPSTGRRWLWVAAGGALLALAVHSQVVAAVPAAGILAGHAATGLRHPRRLAAELGAVAGAAAAVTGAVALAAWVRYGTPDIVGPTVHAIRFFSTPAQLAKWHSANRDWLLRVPVELAPPAVVAAWLATARVGRRPSRPEVAAAAGAGLAVLACWGEQFLGTLGLLEYHLYFSMLGAATAVTAALMLARVSGPLLRSRRTAAVPALAVLAVPFCFGFVPLADRPSFGLYPAGTALAAAAALAAWAGRRPARAAAGVGVAGRAMAGAAVVAVVATLFVLTSALLPAASRLPGTTKLPPPHYAAVFAGTPAATARLWLDRYRVASALHDVVPPPLPGRPGLLCWTPPVRTALNEVTGQYLWRRLLPANLPRLTGRQAAALRHSRAGQLVLLDFTAARFPAAVRALAAAGFAPVVQRTARLHAGALAVSVEVLRLGGSDRSTGGQAVRGR